MTTTAHEDQFTAEPEHVTHRPYDAAAILRQNIADLERELQRQRERADRAEAELKAAMGQEPVAWMVAHDAAQQLDLTLLKTEAEAIAREMQEEHFNHGEDGVRIPARITPLYTRPIPAPAPAVPEGCAIISRTLTPEAWKRLCNADIWPVTPQSFQKMLDVRMEVAMLQSAPAAPAVPDGDDFNGTTPHLIQCMEALVRLDADGVLVPHGIGRDASKLLSAAANRLRKQTAPSVPEEWLEAAQRLIDAAGDKTCSSLRCNYPMDCCSHELIGAMDAMIDLLQSAGGGK